MHIVRIRNSITPYMCSGGHKMHSSVGSRGLFLLVADWQKNVEQQRVDPLRLHLSSRHSVSLFSHFQGSARSICGGGRSVRERVSFNPYCVFGAALVSESIAGALSTRLARSSFSFAAASWALSRAKSILRRDDE